MNLVFWGLQALWIVGFEGSMSSGAHPRHGLGWRSNPGILRAGIGISVGSALKTGSQGGFDLRLPVSF